MSNSQAEDGFDSPVNAKHRNLEVMKPRIEFQFGWDVNLAYFELDMFTYFSNIFLAIRRTVDNSERLLSFPRPAQQAFERERKGFKLGRGKGEGNGTLIISPSHAHKRAPEFLSPSLSKACH